MNTKDVTPENRASQQFRRLLEDELVRRCQINPRYSQRAFAKSLSMDQSALSKYMRGERKFSNRLIEKLSTNMGLPPQYVFQVIEDTRGKGRRYSRKHEQFFETTKLDAISEWYYFALLELLKLDGRSHSTTNLSSQLGVPTAEIKIALKRLEELGYIESRISNDGLVATYRVILQRFSYRDLDSSSDTRKKLQKQFLAQAQEAIDRVPYSERENASMTIITSKKSILHAKEKIHNFISELQKELNDFPDKEDEVYQLAVAWFPLTKTGGGRS